MNGKNFYNLSELELFDCLQCKLNFMDFHLQIWILLTLCVNTYSYLNMVYLSPISLKILDQWRVKLNYPALAWESLTNNCIQEMVNFHWANIEFILKKNRAHNMPDSEKDQQKMKINV